MVITSWPGLPSAQLVRIDPWRGTPGASGLKYASRLGSDDAAHETEEDTGANFQGKRMIRTDTRMTQEAVVTQVTECILTKDRSLFLVLWKG